MLIQSSPEPFGIESHLNKYEMNLLKTGPRDQNEDK